MTDYEFFVRYLDAWNQHAIDEVVEFLTDDCTYSDVALNESHIGHDDIRRFGEHMEQEFSSDYHFERGFALVTDNGYALEWVMKGTHDRGSPQVPATGKPYAIRGVLSANYARVESPATPITGAWPNSWPRLVSCGLRPDPP